MANLEEITKEFTIDGIELDTGRTLRKRIDCSHINIAHEEGRLRWVLVWDGAHCHVYNVDHVIRIHFTT